MGLCGGSSAGEIPVLLLLVWRSTMFVWDMGTDQWTGVMRGIVVLRLLGKDRLLSFDLLVSKRI